MLRFLTFSALVTLWGCVMAEQTISALTDDDIKRLDDQREVVAQYLTEDSKPNYETAPGKLGTLRALLDAEIFKPDQTYELQSMGIVFGDVFVQDMGFSWVMVEDEYGRDPAIRYQDTSIILFPSTMISKRVEKGETVDVFDLYNGAAALAQEQIDAELTN
jgi:hypothetical protein